MYIYIYVYIYTYTNVLYLKGSRVVFVSVSTGERPCTNHLPKYVAVCCSVL